MPTAGTLLLHTPYRIYRNTDYNETGFALYASQILPGQSHNMRQIGTDIYLLGNFPDIYRSRNNGSTWTAHQWLLHEPSNHDIVAGSDAELIVGGENAIEILAIDPNLKLARLLLAQGYARRDSVITAADQTGTRAYFYPGRLHALPDIGNIASQDILGGGASIQLGNITLENNDGDFDSQLTNSIFSDSEVRLYTGMVGGIMPADFTLRHRGRVQTVESDRRRVVVSLSSQQEQLEQSINGSTYGTDVAGTSPQFVGQPVPVVLGPFIGIPAAFTAANSGTRIWTVASHPIGTVTAVRDPNGTSHAFLNNAADYANGYFSATSYTSGSVLFCDGTGYKKNGTSPKTPGEIIKYILGRIATRPGTEIGTAALATLDTDRPVNLSCWFGDNESVGSAIDAVCRSVGADWALSRNGSYYARARGFKPPNDLITNGGWERGGLATSGGALLDGYASNLSSISSSKMLLYSYSMLKDSVSGPSLYKGTRAYAAAYWAIGVIGSNLSAGSLALFGKFGGTGTGSYTAYEGILNPGGTAFLNKVVSAVRTTIATAVINSVGTFGTLALYLDRVGAGTQELQFNGSFVITATDTAIGSSGSVSAVGWSSDFVGTVYQIGEFHPSGSWVITDVRDGTFTAWDQYSNASHAGTSPRYLFRGTSEGWVSKPVGTAGTMAKIQQRLIAATQGQSYCLSMVAAKISGSADSFRVSYIDASDAEHLRGTHSLGTGTFTRVTHLFSPGSTGIGTVVIYPSYNATAAGTIAIDDISLYQVNVIENWQVTEDFSVSVKNPTARALRIRHLKPSAGNAQRRPPNSFSPTADINSNYIITAGTSEQNTGAFFPSSKTVTMDGLCYDAAAASELSTPMLEYLSQPVLMVNINRLNWEGNIPNLWDIIYLNTTSIPLLPDQSPFFVITAIRELHPVGAVPQLELILEAPFYITNDILAR